MTCWSARTLPRSLGPVLLLCLWMVTSGCRVGTFDIDLVFCADQNPFTLGVGTVDELRVRIEADDLSPIEDSYPVSAGGVASLPSVPVGEGRILTVEGVSDRGACRSA